MEPRLDPTARPPAWRWGRRLLAPLRRYHRHRVEGLENLPLDGAALVAIHHSLATYDLMLLGLAVGEQTGRYGRGLGDDRLFEVPALARLATACGIERASPEMARALLRAGGLVMVAPGGMREALRPRSQRRKVAWAGRYGFARLAVELGVPVVPVACPAADDLYTVYDAPWTRPLYDRFHIPVPLARGLGPTLLPRRVQLVHRIGAPIAPAPERSGREAVEDLQRRVVDAVQALLDRGAAPPTRPLGGEPGVDRAAHA